MTLGALDVELAVLDLGLDRVWSVATAVQVDAVLLWHLWYSEWREVQEGWLVQPVHVSAHGTIELIEWVEDVQGGWNVRVSERSGRVRSMGRMMMSMTMMVCWSEPSIHIKQ